MRTRRQALIKDLSRFLDVVLIVTLVVLYYRPHTKYGVLLEVSMSKLATYLLSLALTCRLIVLAPSSSPQYVMSDRASKALAQVFLPEERRTYDTISKRSKVPPLPSTIVHMGDARKNRRLRANSISLHRKRKPSKSF